MKKILMLIASIMMIAAIAGCGSEEPKEVDRDLLEGNYTEMGDGDIYLVCAGGSTEDGNVPVMYESASTTASSFGINARGFNGGNLSFIYVDGILLDKEQLADSQITVQIAKEQLTFGVHKVEVVQYENDDPAANMITYRTFSYEVKEK